MASLSSHLDGADLTSLPLPLAQLLRRVQNAKTAYERHQAAFYYWEATLKLMSAVAVCSLMQNGGLPDSVAKRLPVLRRPSLGHWWELLRATINVESSAGRPAFLDTAAAAFSAKRRTDLPRLAGMHQFLQESLQGKSSTAPVVNLSNLIDALIQYRNREIGHGALGQKSSAYYDRAAATFAAAGVEFANATGLAHHCRLRFISDVRLLADRRWQADQYDLSGEMPRRRDPYEPRSANGATPPLPRCLYLANGDNGETDGAPSLSLYPFLTYDEDTQEVAFYNSVRGRDLEFLGYSTGAVTRTGLIGGALPGVMQELFGAVDQSDSAAEADAAPAPLTDAAEPVGDDEEWIGDYQLVSRLDSGGMGVVYRACQPILNREVALKVLIGAGDPRAETRFTREIKALGRVDHPNLVKIFSSGVSGNRWYYAMELIKGANVASICDHIAAGMSDRVGHEEWKHALELACNDTLAREEPLTSAGSSGEHHAPDENGRQALKPSEIKPFEARETVPPVSTEYVEHIVRIVRQVAHAVHALHANGVIHRDIKPANIMVTGDKDNAVLMDLGLAQMMDETDGRLTRTRQFVGTLRYASPEQVLAVDQVTVRSDVYSLGATLWELLTLHPLFGAGAEHSTVGLMQQIQSKEPVRPRKYSRAISSDLEAIVMKCLEKDPDRRYASALDLARDLERWEKHEVVHAQPLTAKYFVRKYVRRNRRRIALITAAVLLLFSSAVAGVWKINDLRKQAEVARHVAEETSADLALQRGVQMCEAGDAALGLLWLAHALDLTPEDSAIKRVIRVNLASWSSQIAQLSTCVQHDDWVRCVAFSPDGKHAASGTEGGMVRIWNTADGSLLFDPLEVGAPVRTVLFAGRGRTLITAAESGRVEFWDAATGAPQGDPIVYEPGIRGACISGDEKLLMTAGGDGTARIWDVATRSSTGVDLIHQDRLNAVACSQDGRIVAAGGRSGLVRLWDSTTAEELHAPLEHDDQVLDVAISPDDRWVAAATFGGEVVLWDLQDATASPRRVKHNGPVGSVAFSEQGDRLATSSWDATARLWEVETLQPICPPMPHRSQVYAVALSPDGSTASSGCWDGVARIWQLPSSASVTRVQAHEHGTRDLAPSPDGDFLVTGGEDKAVRIWSTSNFAQRRELPHDAPIFAVAVSDDGRRVASATRGGDAFVWDAGDGELIAGPLSHDGREIYSIAFCPDGDQLLTGCHDEHARLWDIPSQALIGKPLSHPGRVQYVTYEPATSRFATAAWQGEVWLFDPKSVTPAVTLLFESPATCLDFSPRDRRLAISTQGGLVHFIDPSGQETVPPLRVEGLAWTVQFHPELDLVLTGTMGGSAQVWDAQTGRPLGVRFTHRGATEAAAFLPGHANYILGSSDGSFYVCDLPHDLEGSRGQLITWIQVITGMELDEHGVARVLEESDWTDRARRLAEAGGPPELRGLQ